jgi:hypothetical protein
MTRSEFQTQYAPVVQQYFPTQFGDTSSNSQHATFNSWVIDWDKYTDAYPDQTPAGDGVIGDVWSETQIRMSSAENVTWVDALLQPSVQLNLGAMAVAMQQTYRSVVLKSYMSDPVNLTNVSGPVIDAFLCWVSLPLGRLDTRPGVLAANITSQTAVNNLCSTRTAVASMLQGMPSVRRYAQFWDPRPSVVRNWLGSLSEDIARVQQVVSFLMHEDDIIDTATRGFESLRKANTGNLDEALDAMVAAGLNLTSAFNTKMGSLFDSAHVVRYFGPLMFQSAIEALFPDKAPRQTDVRFNVAVLRQGQFPTTADLGLQPDSKQILLQQMLINFS